MERMTKALLAAVAMAAVLELGLVGANFLDKCDITWEPQNAKMTEGGNHLTLSLVSNSSGKATRSVCQEPRWRCIFFDVCDIYIDHCSVGFCEFLQALCSGLRSSLSSAVSPPWWSWSRATLLALLPRTTWAQRLNYFFPFLEIEHIICVANQKSFFSLNCWMVMLVFTNIKYYYNFFRDIWDTRLEVCRLSWRWLCTQGSLVVTTKAHKSKKIIEIEDYISFLKNKFHLEI